VKVHVGSGEVWKRCSWSKRKNHRWVSTDEARTTFVSESFRLCRYSSQLLFWFVRYQFSLRLL